MQAAQGSKEDTYLNGRWKRQRDHYSQRSKWYKRWHQSLIVFSTLAAIVVPVLLNIPHLSLWLPTILSLLVSLALALDNICHFGDNWRIYRQALEALYHERACYEAGIKPYHDPHKAFPEFVRRSEDIMRLEGKKFFEHNREKAESPGSRSI